MLVKRAFITAVIATAALVGLNAPASAQVSAQGWQLVGTKLSWEYCNWWGVQFTDGATGYECRYNENTWLYDLYVGP